jgi:Uma2 family endonuclease
MTCIPARRTIQQRSHSEFEMSAVPEPLRRHVISADEYLRMGEAGVFAREVRLELIEGEIIEMAPIGSPHAGTVKFLNRVFSRFAGDQVIVSVQDPLVVSDRSVPQPDLALLKRRADHYTKSHPTAQDVLLVVEVADTTLTFDVGTKALLYARSGIAEVWVVDVQDRSVRVFREPSPTGYRTSFTVTGSESVNALLVPAVVVALSDLFPA